MFPDKISQRVRTGLRPDRAATQAGVALRIQLRAVRQGQGEESELARLEHNVRENLIA